MTGKTSPIPVSTGAGLGQEQGPGQGQGFIPVPTPVSTKSRGVTTTTIATADDPSPSTSTTSSTSGGGGGVDVIPLIAAAAEKCGIYDDLPYDLSFADPMPTTEPTATTATVTTKGMDSGSGLAPGVGVGVGKPSRRILSPERATELLAGPQAVAFAKEFEVYAGKLRGYLGELEQRLFSEGRLMRVTEWLF